jgi:hypothetical protein
MFLLKRIMRTSLNSRFKAGETMNQTVEQGGAVRDVVDVLDGPIVPIMIFLFLCIYNVFINHQAHRTLHIFSLRLSGGYPKPIFYFYRPMIVLSCTSYKISMVFSAISGALK